MGCEHYTGAVVCAQAQSAIDAAKKAPTDWPAFSDVVFSQRA
jgi:hypothetical protein